MNKAVYAGSFDPITNGHLWMIEEGSRLFDELVVAIGVNPDKQYTFRLDERLAMLIECTQHLDNVSIDSFSNEFLVNYAGNIQSSYIVRGIRNAHDYEYEKGMRNINADLNSEITTVLLIPPRELVEVSSSFVKGLIGPSGWRNIVERYVPPAVFARVLAAHDVQ